MAAQCVAHLLYLLEVHELVAASDFHQSTAPAR